MSSPAAGLQKLAAGSSKPYETRVSPTSVSADPFLTQLTVPTSPVGAAGLFPLPDVSEEL